MASLLAQDKYKPRLIRRGQNFNASVVSINPARIVLDIGSKAEGVVEGEELRAVSEFVKTLKVGDQLEATVVASERSDGLIALSLKNAAGTLGWEMLEKAQKEKKPIEVSVKNVTPNGWQVEAFGLAAFIPMSNLGKTVQPHKTSHVMVESVDRASGRLILSERAISEKDEMGRIDEILTRLSSDEILEGEVVKISPFGVFVEVSLPAQAGKDGTKLEGLVHVSEMSFSHVVDPNEVVSVGEKVKVVVLPKREQAGLRQQGRISFSMKKALPDPWEKLTLEKDSQVSGRIIRETATNFVIDVSGIEGMVAKSKIPAGMTLKVGDKIEGLVEEINKEKKRLKIGLQLKAKPIGYK